MPTHRWDATTYDRVAAPQERWGAAVLERLQLRGSETVLDAGCGTGRVTALLLERLPAGRVVAVDADAAMIAAAQQRFSGDDRVRLVTADLAQPLPVSPPVDAVLSTATFHWVLDHDALFANLAAVMRPGAVLEAQCGGRGNIASLWGAVERTGRRVSPWLFASAEKTTARLAAAAFTDIHCWLHDEPTPFADRELFEDFLATVCLAPFRAAEGARYRQWVAAVATELGCLELDYVRLNISARRSEI